MKLLYYLYVSLPLLFSHVQASVHSIHCPQITRYVLENLPHYGILRQDSQGFVYVDIDDAYIHDLIQLIEEEDFEEPFYFGPGLHGAHISVIHPYESPTMDTSLLSGQTIYFQIKECQIVESPKDPSVVYFLLTVDAPELDTLRAKCGLLPSYYPFHITVGVRRSL